MHHYAHHLGDYRAHTAHLTMLEDGAYRRLLDLYYMHEKALPASVEACQRLTAARTEEERAAVATILEEFFTLEADGWHQSRADEEIATYHGKAAKARENGKAGGRPKTQKKPRDNQFGYSSVSESNPEETVTKNQEPLTNNHCSPADGGKAKRKSKLPDDFEATPERLEYARAQGCADPADTFTRFKLHHQSKGTLALDWEKGWQYWCRNESNFRRPQVGKFAPTAGLPASRDDDSQWRARTRGWRPGRFWNRGDWGPDPTEPGCRAPAAVLNEWRSEAMQ